MISICSPSFTKDDSSHEVLPVTHIKAVACYKAVSFQAQLQHCTSSGNTEHT